MRIVVTGAFGNVGQWVVTELSSQGHSIVCYDIKTERTESKMRKLNAHHEFETIWGDLTDEEDVKTMVNEQKPEALIHVAAIIAPTAYKIPNVAYKVNVLGFKYLIEAVEQLENFKRFVFVSSYSVHGPRNPYKDLPPLEGDSPTNPGDNYGKHKLAGEKMLEQSSLDWIVVRLPAVFSVDSDFGSSSEFRQFSFLLDPNRNQSAIDARDAGLAIANAVSVDVSRKKFDVCGDPTQGWTGNAKYLTDALMNANGVPPLPEEAYHHSDPEVDESWYYEGIVDPTESEQILKYQQHSFQDYLNHIKKQTGFKRHIIRLFSPIIKRILLRDSKYYGEPIEYNQRPMWKVIKEEFDIDENELKIFNNAE